MALFIRRFWKDTQGQNLVEYALAAGGNGSAGRGRGYAAVEWHDQQRFLKDRSRINSAVT